MSLYQGWDRESMLQREVVGNEGSLHKISSGTSLPSFTPINPPREPAQFVLPRTTLYARGLDDDALYNEIPEIPYRTPAEMRKKRTVSQANKGRAISIAQVWEYRDEGDVACQNQGADFEASFPKRNKSAISKRSKSALGQQHPTQSQYTQDGKIFGLMHGTVDQEEEQGSQLTPPPKSSKRHSKKTVQQPRNTNSTPGPFRNPVITKPSVSREADLDKDRTLTKPVTIHQGWTSTQDAVKTHPGYLSKTTLDKLAAFRYKSSAHIQADRPSAIGGTLQPREVVEPIEAVEEVDPASSSDYGFLQGVDSSFGDLDCADHSPTHPDVSAEHQHDQSQRAEWGPDHLQEGDVFFSDVNWDAPAGGPGANEGHSSQDHIPAPKITSMSGSKFRNDADLNSVGGAPPPLPIMPGQNRPPCRPDPVKTQILYDSDHLSSLAVRAVAEGMHGEVPASQPHEDYSAGCLHQPDFFPLTEYGPVAGESVELQKSTTNFTHHQGNLPNHLPDILACGTIGYTPRGQLEGGKLSARKPPSRHVFDVQVERSNFGETETAPRDIPNGFELLEFDDEGIDDADLLAIASDEAIPETQPLASGTLTVRPGLESAEEACPSSICATQPTLPVATDSQLLQDRESGSPERLSHDEYPLEDGLEEGDMLSLPAHPQGVTETFQAPPSLQYSFGNGPMSGEVYARSLQFSSPPKSWLSSVLPAKAVEAPLADGHSPSRAQPIGNLGSHLAEEEDWYFISSNDCVKTSENVALSDPALDREKTRLNEITKCVINLGPQKQRKRISYPKIYTATQASTSEEIVVDDSHEYEPLQPFARPDFPFLVLDRCPIPGVTAQTFLRVCFRVGEMFREGAKCNALKQDAIIELFARVTFSSREPGTTQQHFQFADLWHDRPPFPNGILTNYKTSGLAESESRAFIGAEQHVMARCIGRLRKATRNATGKFIDIINIRQTDWEEVKWTKRIISAGLVKSENVDH
ncbi:hypothetical protein WAI453_010036 [Rhynchosporium graminicola]